MATIPWPERPEQPGFDRLVGPIAQLIRRAYRMDRVKKGEFAYSGYDTPQCMKACDSTPAGERFKGDYLAYSKERGRGILDIALHLLFNYGVEQGIRIERENNTARLERENRHLERELEDVRARLAESNRLLRELRDVYREVRGMPQSP